jgi:hypothetical protein
MPAGTIAIVDGLSAALLPGGPWVVVVPDAAAAIVAALAVSFVGRKHGQLAPLIGFPLGAVLVAVGTVLALTDPALLRGAPWIRPTPSELFDSMICLMMASALAGGLFGLSALAVFLPIARTREHSSMDSLERVLLPSSLWLSAVGVMALRINHTRPLAIAAAALGLAGLAMTTLRDVRRLLWLVAVYRGAVAGWSVVRKDEATQDQPLMLPLGGPYDPWTTDGVLRRTEASGELVAWLPTKLGAGVLPVSMRLLLALVGAVGLGLLARGIASS